MPAIPEPLEKALEKAPPQVGAYVKNVFGLLENEEELKARSTACAIAILSLWAISSFPYMAIFSFLLAAVHHQLYCSVPVQMLPSLSELRLLAVEDSALRAAQCEQCNESSAMYLPQILDVGGAAP